MAKKKNTSLPLLQIFCGVLVLIVAVLGFKVYSLANAQHVQQNPPMPEVTLPAGAVKITECIPREGEHWVEPANIPSGPYYVTWKGKVISTEYMLAPDQIPGETVAKKSPDDFFKYFNSSKLTMAQFVDQTRLALPIPPHEYKTVHIGWTAPHAGFTQPHYDIHFDFVTDAELKSVCPDARLEDVYSPAVMDSINKNNIPFPGQ
jgi:hypothetical protein